MWSENRLKTGQFAPGNCGNPGGRPKKTEPERRAEELFRKKTPEAARELLSMAGDIETPAKVRVDIYKYVLDRALGKPKVSGEIDINATITPASILEALDARANRQSQ
jgi:hypothetical protein